MYSVRILRRAVKDIANLPKGYANLVSEHIDRYDIDDSARVVTIYRVKHRREAYR